MEWMKIGKWSWPRFFMVLAAIVIVSVAAILAPEAIEMLWKTSPEISVWYGPRQVFGEPGLAQRWVNILGSVPAGESGETSMEYTLNGGAPVRMRLGPDDRRLVSPGDFNIEIDPAMLRDGDNQLVITAINDEGRKSTARVNIVYHRQSAPLPYSIDWSRVRDVQQALQIVDGRWKWDASGIRTLDTGYDRMLVVGDSNWTDYQVTVPVTFHDIDSQGFRAKNSGEHAGVSIDMRWLGHSDDPARCPPPHCGWNPMGDLAKYFIKEDGQNYLGLKVKEKEKGFPTLPYQFQTGHTYVFKASVQSTPQGNLYKMSVWEQGRESEPARWMFERLAPDDGSNPDHGAFALVAHYIDVTFGNITVEPLE